MTAGAGADHTSGGKRDDRLRIDAVWRRDPLDLLLDIAAARILDGLKLLRRE